MIRGEASNGMLVSERELGLSDEHDGIIDLPDDAPVGASFAAWRGLDDPVIEIELTPDRADCAGVRGIARDLAAAGLGTLKPLDATPVEGRFKTDLTIGLDFPADATSACPMFAARVFRGVKNGPSPAWLQARLKAIGLRPISALVDITNFFTFDLSRPLHVFDAGKVRGGLRLRLSQGGETLAALNDKTYTLGAGVTVIADDSGVAQPRRHHGRRARPACTEADHRGVPRGGAVRPGAHGDERPGARRHQRCALPLRARRRSRRRWSSASSRRPG